ncbi:Fibronectin/fibrinogen-binding protein [Labilithrix luteola]|uniref:Fibronectin/fibrinogen-binding protein n=1 Tax=Labilithrix luteola TaxID=1391654 RepID=A0A0K1Q9W5_9BACT|nr:NFACT RNA binding domain-containing protein [Labilithrix luteola]AKV02581.1 Fibronectin/fibrinogen-binding protein [Labilithrix luteola]
MTPNAPLEGPPSAFVQEADCAEQVVVLKVRVPGRTSFVVVGATRSMAAAGLLSSDVRKATWGGKLPAGFARQRAREDALEGTRVLAIGPSEVFIDQQGASRVLRVEGRRVIVTDAPLPPSLPAFVDLDEQAREALEARGRELAEALAGTAIEERRIELQRTLDKAKIRIERRREAIRTDLAKIAEADKMASQASWLIAEAKRAPRGAKKLVVTDWSTGEPIPLEVPLDPSKSASEQVEAIFKRAKRLRLGGRVASDRLTQTETQLAAVLDVRERLGGASTLPELEALALEAKRSAPRDVTLPQAGITTGAAGAKAKLPTGRSPYRTFVARSGKKLLVGKGAADNDALTLKIARPHDLWLHAKDRTGAHVIVSLEKGQTCPAEDLVDAALLAAHFSDARDERAVDVQYTSRRYLRKPKGSPPGFVIVDREKVLALRVDTDAVRLLLEREDF